MECGFDSRSEYDMLEQILLEVGDEDILKADGFDDAIIGIDMSSLRLIYSVRSMLDILMRDMSEEDAREYLDFNVLCAYVGEKTPIYCHDDFTIL